MEQSEVKLISQVAFSKLAGVTAGAITYQIKKLGDAAVGRKININHINAQAYIADKEAQREIKALEKPAIRNGKIINPDVPSEPPQQVVPAELANLTLQEIVDLYGSLPQFRAYVSTQKEFDAYKNNNLKWRQNRGQLIDKKFLATVCLEALELLFSRFVDDLPLSLSSRVKAIAQRGDDDADYLITQEIVAVNSRALKICKDTIISRLDISEKEVEKNVAV